MEHPPLAQILLDVAFRNLDPDPRWFLLPGELGVPAVPREHGIFGAAPIEVRGRGRAVVIRFEGIQPVQALCLPGHAEVRLRRLPLARHGRLPTGTFCIEVTVATSLDVQDEPVAAWIGADPTSDLYVDASCDDATRLKSRYTPGYTAVPVRAADERTFTLELALPEPRT